MPTNNNQNANQNQQTNAPKGDILTQIVAKDASLKDLYLLERTMSASVANLEKIQQKSNTTLTALTADVAKGNKTLLSIDTSMQQVLRKIDTLISSKTQSNTLTPTNNTIDLSNIETVLASVDKTTINVDTSLSNLNQEVSDISTTLSNYVATHPSGPNIPPTPDANNSSSTDLTTVETSLNNIEQLLSNMDNTLVTIKGDTADIITSLATRTASGANPVPGSSGSNTIDLTNIETILSAIQSTTDTIETLLTEINQTTLDTETSLSNVDQNTFDILTTLSNYVASKSGGTPPPSPPPSPPDTVDLTEVESLLDSIDQTAFDILTAIGNINNNNGRNNPPSNPPSPGPGRSGGTDFASLLQQNQYLLTAMNALNNNLNIRDELAALLRAQQPTLGQDDLDEQLTEILRGITVPLNSSVKTEEELKELIDRLNQRVAEGWMTQEEANRLQLEATNNYMTAVLQQAEDSKSFAEQLKDKFLSVIPDMLKNAGGTQAITADIITGSGNAVGEVVGTAIKVALPGVVGQFLGEYADKVIGGLTKNLSDYLGYITTNAQNVRNEIIKSGFEKIRKDVNDMASYSIDIYTKSVNDLYSAWDTNLGKVTATQGYTKEALNTLQDAVAQRLQAEGYGNVINAGDYINELANTLNSKLGGELAEAFAAQNLILQKAVPEVDLSSMGETFASIYRSAELQGVDAEELMISAMNQVAGATKALEETTSGNNQFISQIDNLLKKANEVVLSSNGTADQVAEMATQLMAAEAPLSAIAPQLSGFTSTLIDKLLSGNDATAVALRAIMNTLDSDIGISETAFRKSLMEDTQGVLSTAFEAIGQFINDNSNETAQYEFYKSMETVFGISSNQLAQIDFSTIAQQIAEASTATNMKALTDAENLVRAGETTTLEEQLVANTSNQLLATNAIADTLDNALMRKLEQNELALERQIYVLQAEQVVNLAEKTMGYFTGLIDIVRHALDPLGLFDGLSELIGDGFSGVMDAQKYLTTTTASSIGSAVADRSAADAQTWSNTVGVALSVAAESLTSLGQTNATILEARARDYGTVNTFTEMMKSYTQSADNATQTIVDTQATVIDSVRSSADIQTNLAESIMQTEDQIRASQTYQEKIATATQANTTYEQKRAEALQQQRALQEAERTMTTANHDNIEAIRESVSKLDELSNYLSPILDENRNQSGLLQTLSEKMDQLMQALANNAVKTTITSPTPNVNTSYNERDRIYGPIKTW